MTDVGFYHLTRTPLERALPKLLEKAAASGRRAVVLAASPERVEALNALLWTYDPGSFLPHGSARDGRPADQPIWLTTADERPNGATLLVLVDGTSSARLSDYERCLDLFDGGDPEAVAAARDRWKAAKAVGHALTYWQQTDQGGWQKKA
ncbi:MAG: DNA polymerase III subunit chi [Alphaproteobacteria bacterium]